jgi:hypothetical protein
MLFKTIGMKNRNFLWKSYNGKHPSILWKAILDVKAISNGKWNKNMAHTQYLNQPKGMNKKAQDIFSYSFE